MNIVDVTGADSILNAVAPVEAIPQLPQPDDGVAEEFSKALQAIQEQNESLRAALNSVASQDSAAVSAGTMLGVQAAVIQTSLVNEISSRLISQASKNVEQLTHIQ